MRRANENVRKVARYLAKFLMGSTGISA